MTSKAVAHSQGHVLIDDIHGLNFAVACLAEYAGRHMRPVVKICMIGQRVDTLPLQRCTRLIKSCQLFNRGTVGLGYLVAVHALLDGRYAGLPRLECTGMAIEARDFQNSGVQSVGIRNGLFGRVATGVSVRLSHPPDAHDRQQ